MTKRKNNKCFTKVFILLGVTLLLGVFIIYWVMSFLITSQYDLVYERRGVIYPITNGTFIDIKQFSKNVKIYVEVFGTPSYALVCHDVKFLPLKCVENIF